MLQGLVGLEPVTIVADTRVELLTIHVNQMPKDIKSDMMSEGTSRCWRHTHIEYEHVDKYAIKPIPYDPCAVQIRLQRYRVNSSMLTPLSPGVSPDFPTPPQLLTPQRFARFCGRGGPTTPRTTKLKVKRSKKRNGRSSDNHF